MSLLKKVNGFKRNITHNLTKHIGSQARRRPARSEERMSFRKVLIIRPNKRLGNLLLVTPLLQEVLATFPECQVDLFLKGKLGSIIFGNYPRVRHIIQVPTKPLKAPLQWLYGWISLRKTRYDLVINVIEYSSSGRLASLFSRASYKCFGFPGAAAVTPEDAVHAGKAPVYALRDFLQASGIPTLSGPISSMNLKLSEAEITEGAIILSDVLPAVKPVICIFTYATGEKRFPDSWWMSFYVRLLRDFPDCQVLEILPKENISAIGFLAPVFYSLDIRKIGALIANAAAFVGTDSGMMHLAASVSTPTIGLFSVTSKEMYGPYGPGSLALKPAAGETDSCIEALRRILPERPKSM